MSSRGTYSLLRIPVVDLYIPTLTPRLHSCEVALELAENTTCIWLTHEDKCRLLTELNELGKLWGHNLCKIKCIKFGQGATRASISCANVIPLQQRLQIFCHKKKKKRVHLPNFVETSNSMEQSSSENTSATQIFKKFPAFMEPEVSLSCSKEPATGHYIEPDESSLLLRTPFP